MKQEDIQSLRDNRYPLSMYKPNLQVALEDGVYHIWDSHGFICRTSSVEILNELLSMEYQHYGAAYYLIAEEVPFGDYAPPGPEQDTYEGPESARIDLAAILGRRK